MILLTYLMCHWIHNLSNEPILLYSELDYQRYEVRKIELYTDGQIGYATQDTECDGTRLGLEPVPVLSEISKYPEFVAIEINKDDFKKVWNHFVSKN